MATARHAEELVIADRKDGVVVPCLVCGGRGEYPVESAAQSCARCSGGGEEPAGLLRALVAR